MRSHPMMGDDRNMFHNNDTKGCSSNEESLASALKSLSVSLKENQETTRESLVQLNDSIEKLVEAQIREHGQGEENLGIDRTTVRLDGIEVYAVVSALTIATSIACFDVFTHRDFEELWRTGSYVELFGIIVFLVAGTIGTVSGIHSTLLFSLMTMYGRTAVGLGNDEAFAQFFKSTAEERYRGFQTFLFSMYSFLVQVVIMVTSKCPDRIRVMAFVITLISILGVYSDTRRIVEKAGIIFVPPQNSNSKKSN